MGMPGRTLKETRSSLAAMVAGQADGFTARCQPEGRVSGQLVAQPLPQVEDCLGVNLAGPALGHAENVADLGKVQTLVVVEGQHLALAVVQALDRLGELPPRLFELDGRAGCIALVLQGVAERLAPASALAKQDVVEL